MSTRGKPGANIRCGQLGDDKRLPTAALHYKHRGNDTVCYGSNLWKINWQNLRGKPNIKEQDKRNTPSFTLW